MVRLRELLLDLMNSLFGTMSVPINLDQPLNGTSTPPLPEGLSSVDDDDEDDASLLLLTRMKAKKMLAGAINENSPELIRLKTWTRKAGRRICFVGRRV